MRRTLGVVILLSAVHACVLGQTAKPKLTIDEFFNFVSFDSLKVAPDGNSGILFNVTADHSVTATKLPAQALSMLVRHAAN